MTRRESVAAIVRSHELWKERHHYREGGLPWQFGRPNPDDWFSLWPFNTQRCVPSVVAR